MDIKTVSFKALQKMAQEFDELGEDSEFETFRTAMDFYLYVVDNHEAVEKEVSKNT